MKEFKFRTIAPGLIGVYPSDMKQVFCFIAKIGPDRQYEAFATTTDNDLKQKITAIPGGDYDKVKAAVIDALQSTTLTKKESQNAE